MPPATDAELLQYFSQDQIDHARAQSRFIAEQNKTPAAPAQAASPQADPASDAELRKYFSAEDIARYRAQSQFMADSSAAPARPSAPTPTAAGPAPGSDQNLRQYFPQEKINRGRAQSGFIAEQNKPTPRGSGKRLGALPASASDEKRKLDEASARYAQWLRDGILAGQGAATEPTAPPSATGPSAPQSEQQARLNAQRLLLQ